MLKAMAECDSKLSSEEAGRNKHSPAYLFTYTPDDLGVYEAPGHFSAVQVNHAKLTLVRPADWYVPRDKLVKGLCKGVHLDVYYPGFPTFRSLKFSVCNENCASLIEYTVLIFFKTQFSIFK